MSVLRWLFLTFNPNKTHLGKTGCLGYPYFLLTGCLDIQFFYSSLSKHSQLGYLSLPTPHCAAPVWLPDAMPCHCSQHASHSTLPRETHLGLLAYWQPVNNNSRLIFKHVKTNNVLLAVKNLDKSTK